MADGPVSQILFRTFIAAVNSTSHLRVYTTDVFGNIRESLYENGWANGTINNVIAQGKIGSPIAATSKELNEIRVYYISNNNHLKEIAYSAGRGWYAGDLNARNYAVAPYSKVAATFLPGNGQVLRVYVQSPHNTIQEYGYDNGTCGWQKMTNIGAAVPGTEIATTSYQTSQLSIRTYFQDKSLNLIEKAYDASTGWYTGGFSVPSAQPRASLAVTSFNASSSGISLRVYYGASSNRILEKGYDGSNWYDGGFNQPSIPGSEVAVIDWGTGAGLQLRVYFQNGTSVTGVSEWVYSGGWSKGVSAIPPA